MTEQKQITREKLEVSQATEACYLIFRYDARYTPPKFIGAVRGYDAYEPYDMTFPTAVEAQAYIDAHYVYQAPTPFPPKHPLTAQEREERARAREIEQEEARREQAIQDAEDAEQQQKLEQEIISGRHPAFTGYAAYLESHPKALQVVRDEMDQGMEYLPVSNEECLFFCLQQICKAGKQYPEGATRQEIRRVYADVKARGGDAWAEHKARMQQLTK